MRVAKGIGRGNQGWGRPCLPSVLTRTRGHRKTRVRDFASAMHAKTFSIRAPQYFPFYNSCFLLSIAVIFTAAEMHVAYATALLLLPREEAPKSSRSS